MLYLYKYYSFCTVMFTNILNVFFVIFVFNFLRESLNPDFLEVFKGKTFNK